MSLEAIAFFRKAALGYIRGDIQELIGSQLTCAGPLLSITVNGIDLVGGICFSFTKGSRERSIEYMTTHMKLNRDVATALYVGVRCGIAHQGMPKIGFNFFLLSHRHEPRTIVYKSDGRYLWLNVTSLPIVFWILCPRSKKTHKVMYVTIPRWTQTIWQHTEMPCRL